MGIHGCVFHRFIHKEAADDKDGSGEEVSDEYKRCFVWNCQAHSVVFYVPRGLCLFLQ